MVFALRKRKYSSLPTLSRFAIEMTRNMLICEKVCFLNSYSAQFKPQLYLFITSGFLMSHTLDLSFYSINFFLFLLCYIDSDENSESVISRYALLKSG